MKTLANLIRVKVLLLSAVGIILISCTGTDYSATQGPMYETYLEGWTTGNTDGVDGVLADNFSRVSTGGDTDNLDTLKSQMSSFPDTWDATITITDQVHSANKGAIYWTFEGTHKILGKDAKVSGMSIVYYENGKIAREIVTWNASSFVSQLGGLIFPPSPPRDNDALDVSPDNYNVIMENDTVRVIRITYSPGDEGVEHSHRAGVVIFPPGGEENEWNVSWSPAQTHNPGGGSGGGSVDALFVEFNH